MAFENSDVVTTFTGAFEHPLSENGKWSQTTPDRGPLTRTGSGSVTNTVGSVALSTYIAAQLDTSSGVIEAFGCADGGQLGAGLETWRISFFTSYGVSGTYGYLVYRGGGLGKEYRIRRYDGSISTFTSLAVVGAGYPEKLGFRINGDAIEVWELDTVGTGGLWVMVLTVDDTTYRGTFYAGLGIEEDSSLGFSCFGGNFEDEMPQIYRRPNE